MKQDVERIAREIRRSTEKYGSYSDAGDFYIAEMEYRRSNSKKKQVRSILFYLALSLYKLFSNYGESPSRALVSILIVWLLPAVVITIFQSLSFSQFLTLCGNTLANMISLQIPSEGVLKFCNLMFIWIVHKITGISIITLFLLAVRRRFRR